MQAPKIVERKRRRAAEESGITVSEMLAHIVSLSPVGIVVVHTYRDVVYTNNRARELGLVRDRLLDDRAWLAAQRTLTSGEDVEVDLSPTQAGATRAIGAVRAWPCPAADRGGPAIRGGLRRRPVRARAHGSHPPRRSWTYQLGSALKEGTEVAAG